MKIVKMMILDVLIDIGLFWSLDAARKVIYELFDYDIPLNIYTLAAATILVILISLRIDKWKQIQGVK